MRIEGQDPLIRILEQINNSSIGHRENGEHLKPEEVLKEVKLALSERDQVLLTGEKGSLEITYSRKPGETPETYLQRISLEISRQIEREKEVGSLNQMREGIEGSMEQTALYHELAKKEFAKERSSASSSNESFPGEKLLYIFAITVVISAIVYILFKV
ncbi:hypothetical protein [Proteiniclasticum ruminis]|uniref:hypothetical protein n=1 Tax=Proteiniclasticum ruminis TaxID=398199 RepID=UPI0028AA66FC|nr:hypothetical protein [Proteiniclasticum ruminis]